MKSPWTPARDKRLLTLQKKGHSAAEIAEKLGTSRSAVIGRSVRLRGIVYKSSIRSWKKANAKRAAEAKERAQERAEEQRKALREMVRAVKGGMAREKAMARAFKAGAYWWQIGDHFGISQQAAYEAAKKTRRARR
jgi:hypothetical protein